MATKMSNKHINKILKDSKKYSTPSVFVYLVHISNEIKAKSQDLIPDTCNKDRIAKRHFLIQTGTRNNLCDDFHKKQALAEVLEQYINYDRRTIYSAIDELIELEILHYNDEYLAWELTDMSSMFNSSHDTADAKGFTQISDVLLSETFIKCKPWQKKLWLFLCQLKSSKGSKDFSKYTNYDFEINLFNMKYWSEILKTKNIYFARYRLNKFIEDNKEEIHNVEKEGIYKFKFNAPGTHIRKNQEDDFIEITNTKEINMINQKISERNNYYMQTEGKLFSVAKNKIYQLVRVIRNFKYQGFKELVVDIILNKLAAIDIYNSRETIKSLPAYAFQTARDQLKNYEHLLCNIR